ncbi:unnamed protein product [Chrysodeixis includens]|uniref:Galectin n=1 Tax=Chrysodeixis includens TaxID=689277 RepID=A0A9P0C3P7_CHRIL|nr:unnamed protein product [Chrysodeixis includens]
MLKSCWDCLVGYDLMREGTRSEEPYSVQLNGNVSRAPPWPTPRLSNEKMFVIPKRLEEEDKIIVNCQTKENPSELKIGLVTGAYTPDYDNLACQLEMLFNDNKVNIRVIQGGNHTVEDGGFADDYNTDTNFEIKFQIRNSQQVDIFVGGSHITSVNLVHNLDNIRFLTVNGDIIRVSSLNFEYGPSY